MSLAVIALIAVLAWVSMLVVAIAVCKAAASADAETDRVSRPQRARPGDRTNAGESSGRGGRVRHALL